MIKKKILLIDDEADFCFFTKKNLEHTGAYNVLIENDPEKGIHTAIEQKPDFIFLDIIMPKMDGSEVAYRISSNPATKDIPIVFLTCLAEERDINKDTIGGRKFISKPCQVADLVAMIEKVLSEQGKA